MSQEDITWLRQNVMMGFQDPRYGRMPAWHFDAADADSVANHFDGPIPIDAILDRLLSWHVEERSFRMPILAPVPEGMDEDDVPLEQRHILNWIVDDARKILYRSDTSRLLGVHGVKRKTTEYPEWLLDTPADILDQSKGELGIGSIGLLRGGGVAWCSIELPETVKTKAGVPFLPRLLMVTSHDGTSSNKATKCTIIVQCDNTLTLGLTEGARAGAVFKVRHTANSQVKIGEMRDALGLVFEMADDFAAEIDGLVDTKVSDKEFDKFLESLLPMPENAEGRAATTVQTKRAILTRLWSEDERVAPWKNTAWGALMATNTAEQWEYGVKGSRAERNFQKTAYGQFDNSDASALKTLQVVLA